MQSNLMTNVVKQKTEGYFMGKFSYFFLVLVAMACLLVSGCGGDNPTYIPVIKPSGKFLYVNNDTDTNNYVSAFTIKSDGTLQEMAGSPYATSGAGSAGGYYAANSIALARTKKLLFVANHGDDTITVFRVSLSTGALTQIGDPVASGGTMGGSGSMAVSDEEKFLFVANDSTTSISVFAISSTGTLTPVTNSPFNIGVSTDGITMNLVGTILYVSAPQSNQLAVLNVAADGTLSQIAGSPFTFDNITSFALASATVGVATGVTGQIASYIIDPSGAPTLSTSIALGVMGQCITTSHNGQLAIVSGGDTNAISVIQVGSDGALAPVAGSPFATAAPSSGYAVANPKGTFLYATEQNQIEAFGIGTDGALTSISSYPLTNPGYAMGLVIY
jgi:6-phosphogluconolactonase